MVRKKKELEPQTNDEASLQIEEDSLAIITKDGLFRLPKEAVDALVASLVVSGFGPQTPAEFNTLLLYRDMSETPPEPQPRHA